METEPLLLWLQSHGLTILLTIIVAAIAYRALGIFTRLLQERIQGLDEIEGSELDRRTETIFTVVHSTGVVIIVGTALLMVLTEIGVSITPVLASVGFVGLAAGLGAQTLVKDMISGLFILLENQYTVGDVVEIQGVTGTVEEMTLRTTELRDLYGTVHIIPNGDIRQVANRSRDWARALIDVNITYEEDVDRAVAVLNEIGGELAANEELRQSLLEAPQVTGVEGLDDWAVRLRIMVKTTPGAQWEVMRYLRRQIRLTFAAERIELAFPRSEIQVRGGGSLAAGNG
jgi:small-conductance mechanosensitive channel